MTAFTPILWFDTFDLACSLKPRMGLFRKRDDGTLVIDIRRPHADCDLDDPEQEPRWLQSREAAKWVELQNIIKRVRQIGETRVQGFAYGRIFVELLPTGHAVPWQQASGNYAETYMRMHLPLRTNPAAMLLVGCEAMHIQAGVLTIVGRLALCSAINAGIAARAHLVLDFRSTGGAT